MLAIGNVPGSGNPMNTQQMYQQGSAQWHPVMNNPAVPYPMLQPTSGQQVPANCHHDSATPLDTNNT